MPGGDVHATGARLHRHEVGCKNTRPSRQKGMLGGNSFHLVPRKRTDRFAGWLKTSRSAKSFHKCCSQNQSFGNARLPEFASDIELIWMDSDREIRRQGPWRRGPDSDACLARQIAARDREFHINGRVL